MRSLCLCANSLASHLCVCCAVLMMYEKEKRWVKFGEERAALPCSHAVRSSFFSWIPASTCASSPAAGKGLGADASPPKLGASRKGLNYKGREGAELPSPPPPFTKGNS